MQFSNQNNQYSFDTTGTAIIDRAAYWLKYSTSGPFYKDLLKSGYGAKSYPHFCAGYKCPSLTKFNGFLAEKL